MVPASYSQGLPSRFPAWMTIRIPRRTTRVVQGSPAKRSDARTATGLRRRGVLANNRHVLDQQIGGIMSASIRGGILLAAGSLALAGCLSDSESPSGEQSAQTQEQQLAAPAATNAQGPSVVPGGDKRIALAVLSSAPDQVTGGNARIAIDAPPGQRRRLSLQLNREPVDLNQFESHPRRLEGVIDGLQVGDNELALFHERFGALEHLTLVNHPITGPVFSGPHQQPFVCTTVDQFGIQPEVDRQEPPGFRVNDEAGETVIGYSTDCSIEPFITYFYRSTDDDWVEWPESGQPPEDFATTTTIDGEEVDFVVRVERGTINRYLFSYAMLVDPKRIPEDPGDFDTSRWNGRLLYAFQGGTGIGHTQGRWSRSTAMDPGLLGLGHAIAYSTGTRTDTHYNLQRGGETALMTKEHFVQRFGEPLYTVGLGGSGGGIQQYVYGQNHPGLIDVAIPVIAYPDMVTQGIHISDCELLERYMDTTEVGVATWEQTENRSWLVGLNATFNPQEGIVNPFLPIQKLLGYNAAKGVSECVAGWRGHAPRVANPTFGLDRVPDHERWEPQSDIEAMRLTHFEDARNIYGLDDQGWARIPWGNVGVQFGLRALTEGRITMEEFLDVNARVGSWKRTKDWVEEGFPFTMDEREFLALSLDRQAQREAFDPWSRRNQQLSDNDDPAPRFKPDIGAIEAAYEAGLVFRGAIDIPVLDVRNWLEPRLDQHHSHQSFAARQRIVNQMGNADHHVVWFGDVDIDLRAMIDRALMVADEWALGIRRDPKNRIAKNRPEQAVDTCFDGDAEIIAAGDQVWAGILDDQVEGPCTLAFPIYTTSRIEAGGPITGDVFQCQLKPLQDARNDGTYGPVSFTDEHVQRLEAIFPDGVCDYDLPDKGRPNGL